MDNNFYFIFTRNELAKIMDQQIQSKYSPFVCHDGSYFLPFPEKDKLPELPKELMSTHEMLAVFDAYEKNIDIPQQQITPSVTSPVSNNSSETNTVIKNLPIYRVDDPNLHSKDTSHSYIDELLNLSSKYCHECHKLFSTTTEKKNHDNRNHYKREIYHCDIPGCENSYTTQASLNLHKKRNHCDKIFECKYCKDKKFAMKGDLNKHIQTCKFRYY